LRGTGEPAETMFDTEFGTSPDGVVTRAALAIDEFQLARLREARLRP
jgi:hypothetical protein